MIWYSSYISPHKITKYCNNYSKEIGVEYFGDIQMSADKCSRDRADQKCDDLQPNLQQKLGALEFFSGGGFGSRSWCDFSIQQTTPFRKRKKSLFFQSRIPPPRAFAPPNNQTPPCCELGAWGGVRHVPQTEIFPEHGPGSEWGTVTKRCDVTFSS